MEGRLLIFLGEVHLETLLDCLSCFDNLLADHPGILIIMSFANLDIISFFFFKFTILFIYLFF